MQWDELETGHAYPFANILSGESILEGNESPYFGFSWFGIQADCHRLVMYNSKQRINPIYSVVSEQTVQLYSHDPASVEFPNPEVVVTPFKATEDSV